MAARIQTKLALGALTLSLMLSIVGCDGGESGGGGGSSSSTPPPGGNTVVNNRVTGSVGDGPIVGARLKVRGNDGKILMETQSSSTADYDITIKTKGKNYAVTIEADQGVDLVTGQPPDFALVSAITKPNTRSISNLNPYTTLIYRAAQKNGGINDSTVAIARDAVVKYYGFGLDSSVVADPSATPIDENNVHVIVKASETLGEMIRRTRDALPNFDGDAVVNALAADLSDGRIDGRGASGSDVRLAAVANVASAAVLVEAMANRLHVYGVDSTRFMDDAIRQVRPNAPASSTTANVGIPAEAFAQAVRALQAAAVVVSDSRIDETIALMQRSVPGSKPADIAPYVPDGIDEVLRSAVQTTAYASDTELAQINKVAGTDDTSAPDAGASDPVDGNTAPTISGSPDTALIVGTPWSFRPTASDAEGDALSFSIQGQPSWASFDSSTGQLAGTPDVAGSYGPITITVSDGASYASLTAFTLQVDELTMGTATVSWVPPTERTDGSALTALGGFKVHYGKNPADFSHIVNIQNPGQTSHFVENLDAGTWYFGVTAYDSEGLESAMSAIASKTIN